MERPASVSEIVAKIAERQKRMAERRAAKTPLAERLRIAKLKGREQARRHIAAKRRRIKRNAAPVS